MPVKDKRPKIVLSEEETTRLQKRLEEMIGEAKDFRKSSEWDDLHADYWRMYRSEPITKTRSWPWEGSSNLYIPLAKVAVNVGMAQEFEAMLSNEPKVIGQEGEDQALADDLTAYYFDYYFKKILPIKIFGTDYLLDNAIDGIAAIKVRQDTDFRVRRSESLEEVPIMSETPIPGMDGSGSLQFQPSVTGIDYQWREEAIIERVNQTVGDVSDMSRIYMAPKTSAGMQAGSALYAESCPWYYQQCYLSWDELLMKRKSIGFDFNEEELKAHLREPDVTEKERALADQTGTSASATMPQIEMLEFYMPWPLPEKYRKFDDQAEKSEEEISQKAGNEDGYQEEIVVDYAPDAHKILLIRPLSRVCPDGKRPHVSMHYRRTPRFIYGSGQCSDLRDLQAGMNKSWNQMVDYCDLSNMPWGLYSPGSTGLLPELGNLEPGRMYPVMDPKSVYFPKFNTDANYYFGQHQSIQNWAEKVSNATEYLQGKAPTTPNAPRTARGQLAMIQMSNVQFAILTGLHSESFIEFFRRVHAFKKRWAPAQEEFRIMNKETGMFRKKTITDKAFQYDADFDFQMNPNRSQAQQMSQMLFGLTISAVQQAIAAPYMSEMIRNLTSDVYRDLGKKNFDQIWPKLMVQNIVMQAQSNAAQNQQQQNPEMGQVPPPEQSGTMPPVQNPEMANLSMNVQGV